MPGTDIHHNSGLLTPHSNFHRKVSGKKSHGKRRVGPEEKV
jgi:hypothetical protein